MSRMLWRLPEWFHDWMLSMFGVRIVRIATLSGDVVVSDRFVWSTHYPLEGESDA